MLRDEIYKELEAIRQSSGGFLHPQSVVDFAKNPETALHHQFEWSDSEAAAKYRLAQARSVIKVAVYVSEQTSEKVKAFVSLKSERHNGVGYRAMAEVLDDEIMAENLVRDAYQDLMAWKRRYEKVRELAELHNVFVVIDEVETKSESLTAEHPPAA